MLSTFYMQKKTITLEKPCNPFARAWAGRRAQSTKQGVFGSTSMRGLGAGTLFSCSTHQSAGRCCGRLPQMGTMWAQWFAVRLPCSGGPNT
jgi:hypothetical protein